MNRRSFFSSLLGSCGAAGTCAVAQSTAPSLQDVSEHIDRNGKRISGMIKQALDPTLVHHKPWCIDRQGFKWGLHWTGWNARVDYPVFIAQWLAYPIHPDGTRDLRRLGVYSGTPGPVWYFHPGDVFMIALHDGQKFIDHRSTDVEKNVEKQLALSRILSFLDKPPEIPPWKRTTLASF